MLTIKPAFLEQKYQSTLYGYNITVPDNVVVYRVFEDLVLEEIERVGIPTSSREAQMVIDEAMDRWTRKLAL